MKHILFLILFLPCLALAQGTVKDSVRVLTTAEISAGTANDTANFYFIQGGTWKKIRMDSVFNYLRFRGMVDTFRAQTILGAKTFAIAPTFNTALGVASGGTNSTTAQGAINTLAGSTASGQYLRGNGSNVTMSAISAGDVPTLNQNTTGSAATLTTARTVQTNLASTSAASFNGSANITPGVTGTLPVGNGGTGQTTLAANKVMVGNGTSGVLTPTDLHWDNSNMRLGIGTSSPAYKLDVSGTNRILLTYTNSPTLRLDYNSTSNYANHLMNNNGDYVISSPSSNGVTSGNLDIQAGTDIKLFTNSTATNVTPQLTLNISGNLGIGTSAPSEKLHVVGNARITGLNNVNDVGASATGILQAATSDINLKNSIQPIQFGLSEILKLEPVSFLYIDENRKLDSDIPDIGFIAQDVFQHIPNAVSSTGESTLQLDYKAITATLVKAMQQQQAQIEALQQRITQLENK